MVRFYLASLFPRVPRLLYLDNDIIVGCCLEEIWGTDLGEHNIAGLALDDLKWAAATQFKYHYNASHPLVIQNIRNSSWSESKNFVDPITESEFVQHLPRYPNDGVILIDVQKWNSNGILERMNEIAMANSRGDWVVNLGTQQFTVLALFDRWVELSPRANLRHFPDMARGYLQWFYYHGFVHYAGAAKPRTLCPWDGPPDNIHRVGSFTPWATSNRQVSLRCPQEKLAYAENCVKHIPLATNFSSLQQLVWRLIEGNADEGLVHVHLGRLHGDLTRQQHLSTDTIHSHKADLVQWLVRTYLHNSSWSFRSYEYDDGPSSSSPVEATVTPSNRSLMEAVATIVKKVYRPVAATPPGEPRPHKHKGGKKGGGKGKGARLLMNQANSRMLTLALEGRTFVPFLRHICDSVHPLTPVSNTPMLSGKKWVQYSTNPIPLNKTIYPDCDSLILELQNERLPDLGGRKKKQQGKFHWDVIAMTVDAHPPSATAVKMGVGTKTEAETGDEFSRMYVINHSSHHGPLSPSSSFTTTRTAATGTDPVSSNSVLPTALPTLSKSFGLLWNIDFTFMRPKVVFVRLYQPSVKGLALEMGMAVKVLTRHGFTVSVSDIGAPPVLPEGGHVDSNGYSSFTISSDGDTVSGCSGFEVGSIGTGEDKSSGQRHFGCVWGTRTNTFELRND